MSTKNSVKLALVVATMVTMSAAVADRLPATKTFEALASSVRMPVSANGTITLRECSRCDFESIQVTPATQYRLNNRRLDLDDFRNVIQDLKLRGKHTVNVRRDEASNTVVAVFVNVRSIPGTDED